MLSVANNQVVLNVVILSDFVLTVMVPSIDFCDICLLAKVGEFISGLCSCVVKIIG
jgi:hypothetical protein